MAIRTGLATVQGYLISEGNRVDTFDENGKPFITEFVPKNENFIPSLDTILENTEVFIEKEREKLSYMKKTAKPNAKQYNEK